MRSRILDLGLGLYLVLCTLSLVWPGLAWVGDDEVPFVLGLPFHLAWSVGWVILTFAVLVAYHLARSRSRA